MGKKSLKVDKFREDNVFINSGNNDQQLEILILFLLLLHQPFANQIHLRAIGIVFVKIGIRLLADICVPVDRFVCRVPFLSKGM